MGHRTNNQAILNRLRLMLKIEEGNIEVYKKVYTDVYRQARITISSNKIRKIAKAIRYMQKPREITWMGIAKKFKIGHW